MIKITLRCWLLSCICFVITNQQNSTRTRQRDSNVMSAIQQMQVQLNAIETESQRQSSRIQEVLRISTRLEAQRQELVATLDRSEARLSQRLEDIKGDARKIMTLQDVTREDVDKMQQNQLLTKVWIEEQFRNLGQPSLQTRSETLTDTAANTDAVANLQILQSTLQGLRRMADTIQSTISTIKINITDIINITKSIQKYEKESLVSKTYFQSSLQTTLSDKMDFLPIAGFRDQGIQTECPKSAGKFPRDCSNLPKEAENTSGIYLIQTDMSQRPIFVYCEMEVDGGGWTVFQRRRDGSVDFFREWQDYKYGFGNVGGEFWLGNENLYQITHQDLYEIRIDLEDFDNEKAFAKYSGFAVGSEREKYMLKLLGPLKDGNAGDGLTYHASVPFSTKDVDYDLWEGGHCARDHTGGWWYNQCDASNLNGKYLQGINPNEYQGVYWHEWHGPSYSLMATRMMIRPMSRRQIVLSSTTTSIPSSEEVSSNWDF